MSEVADARKDEGDAVAIAEGDGLLVLDRAAGLDNGGDACLRGDFGTVREGEEGIGGEGRAFRILARLLDGEADAPYPVHLPRADALNRPVFGDDDGVALDVLDDAPGEEEFGEFGIGRRDAGF